MWPFDRKTKKQKTDKRPRIVLARYDAARTTGANQAHWANADNLSADAAASGGVRRIIRNRARYEVCNNSWARGMVLTLANYTVGTGPRLQLRTDNRELNAVVERRFAEWMRVTALAEKLRVMKMARVVDGESYAYLATRRQSRFPVKLDVRLLECDRVTSTSLTSDPKDIDGVVLDDAGYPVGYRVLKHHPGSSLFDIAQEPMLIGADHMLHWYRPDRPESHRGVSELAPALGLFAQLRRYSAAVLGAAELAAKQARVLETDTAANTSDEDPAPSAEDVINLDLTDSAIITILPALWKLKAVGSEQPTTTHDAFVRVTLNEIARCLNMPYNIAAGTSADSSYAGGRLDLQMFMRSIDVERQRLCDDILDRILEAWLQEAVLMPGFLPGQLREYTGAGALPTREWHFDGFEHVDPKKEADAQVARLEQHAETLARVYALDGRDWEQGLEQRALELAKIKQLEQQYGIKMTPAAKSGGGASGEHE